MQKYLGQISLYDRSTAWFSCIRVKLGCLTSEAEPGRFIHLFNEHNYERCEESKRLGQDYALIGKQIGGFFGLLTATALIIMVAAPFFFAEKKSFGQNVATSALLSLLYTVVLSQAARSIHHQASKSGVNLIPIKNISEKAVIVANLICLIVLLPRVKMAAIVGITLSNVTLACGYFVGKKTCRVATLCCGSWIEAVRMKMNNHSWKEGITKGFQIFQGGLENDNKSLQQMSCVMHV